MEVSFGEESFKVHLLTPSLLYEQKRNLFICEHTPFGSVLLKIDLLELHTDQFSALEPFPIPNLLLDFSQQGATKQKRKFH